MPQFKRSNVALRDTTANANANQKPNPHKTHSYTPLSMIFSLRILHHFLIHPKIHPDAPTSSSSLTDHL